MNGLLRRWGALGGSALAGALVALLGIGLAQLARHDAGVAANATTDERQDGRLAASETWQREHDAVCKPLVGRVERLDRKFDMLFVWLKIVAQREGWPVPPEPARLNIAPFTPPRWMHEARAGTDCKGGCP